MTRKVARGLERSVRLTDQTLFHRDACSALVITCSDFRFKTAERAFLEAAGLTSDYDLIARPGAIRALVAPRSIASRDSMEEEIRLLWSIHHFTRVLMVNHVSCRAYDDLATPENEIEVHSAHLAKAASLVEQRFHDVHAEPYLIDMEHGALRVRSLT